MNNREIAKVFSDIADMLAIKGESRFRIIAYERAAETIEGLGRDIKDIWEAGELEDIPGVGAAIASKIDELLGAGEMAYFEKLKAEIPIGLVEVLNVSGVGPKKAARFWQELGITDIPGLEKAAKNGLLADLPGMGAKSEERILLGIEQLKRLETDRILLGTAVPAAESILAFLRKLPSVKAAEAAGSLRRRRETVGDLDLLAASEEPGEVMAAFIDMPLVDEVRSRGDLKTSVVLLDGLRVQLWVHPPERFGAALQYATGSKDHNVKLRERSLKLGLSLSEHGFKREDGTEILCADETEVYETLDLPWIAPELREDRGEIEAAAKGELPELLELKHIRGDLHTHTDWSDGKATMDQMVQAAIGLGYKFLVISDHSQSLGVANGLSVERLREQRKAIDKMQQKVGDKIALLQGSEVEILAGGGLDYPDELLAELDLVVASLHTSLQQDRATITDRLLQAIQNPHVDIIGHPTGRLLLKRDPADLDMEAVFQAAAENGTVLEINASPERLDLKDSHAQRAVELGCLLAINTDAHHPDHFGLLQYGVATARRAWAQREHVINTWTANKLRRWLDERGT